MKYLCLVYLEESKLNGLSRREHESLAAAALAYDEELRKRGHYIASSALQPADTATTLRRRRGRMAITDGPYAETPEQLGGFALIEARDLNEALHLAANLPPARIGAVEVRPVKEAGTPPRPAGC